MNIIFLTSHHKNETSLIEMFKIIQGDSYLYTILLEQTKTWWGKKIDLKMIKEFINNYIKNMMYDEENNQIIRTIKELIVKNMSNPKELSKLIDKYLIPQELEKKTNAEVSTPHTLRHEMLDKIPADFWTTPKKVFEPCSGKGGFVIDIIDRFMTGLSDAIPDEKLRYKTIVEECLYFSDINPMNIFVCKLLVDPDNKYNIKYNEGNTLELNIKDKWGLDGFDAVIGNPPYNSSGNIGTGNTIWQNFTKRSLKIWLKSDGFLCFVHPPGWRKPNTEKCKFYGLFELMTKENQMIFLSIHGIQDGQKTFKCGTRYDWYLIEKKKCYKNTILRDEKGQTSHIDLKNFKWLPHSNIDVVQKLLAKDGEETCPIIYNRSNYGTDKPYISKHKDSEYIYPIIHTIPQSGTRFMYSKINDKGHFGISKVIFGDNGFNNIIIDMDGEFGMSEQSMAIRVNDINEALVLKDVLLSEKFKSFMKSCIIGNFRIDWRLFLSFKARFWVEFV